MANFVCLELGVGRCVSKLFNLFGGSWRWSARIGLFLICKRSTLFFLKKRVFSEQKTLLLLDRGKCSEGPSQP
jgi:hypothetical protein